MSMAFYSVATGCCVGFQHCSPLTTRWAMTTTVVSEKCDIHLVLEAAKSVSVVGSSGQQRSARWEFHLAISVEISRLIQSGDRISTPSMILRWAKSLWGLPPSWFLRAKSAHYRQFIASLHSVTDHLFGNSGTRKRSPTAPPHIAKEYLMCRCEISPHRYS